MEKSSSSAPRTGLLPAVATCALAACLWHGPGGGSAPSDAATVASQGAPAPNYTLAELRNFHGDGEGPGLLIGIWGRVFNVTKGGEFYAKGAGYQMFAGHDCTRAFAISSTKERWLDHDLEGLSEGQIRQLNETYWTTYVEKYPIVGRLLDPPYDAAAYDQFAGPYAAIQVPPSGPQPASARRGAAQPKRQSKCPVTRAARALGSAIVSLLPRQLAPPSWATGSGEGEGGDGGEAL